MRINGSDKASFNPYQRQIQKQTELKKEMRKDQLEISAEAKQLQKSEQQQSERIAYVESIKNKVQSGEYQVNHEKTAEKLLDFLREGGSET